MKRFILFLLAGLFYTTTMFAQVASITWPLTSTINPNTSIGNIQGLPEIIGVGSPLLSTSLPANLMSIYGYSNGQQLWVGNTGGTWVPDPPAPATPLIDPLRYIQFDASPTTGNIFTVTNVSFNYGDDPNITNFNILNFQAYYSTDGWQTKILLNSTPLVYLNLTMSTFNAQNLSVPVPSGQTFSLRIYMYPVLHGIAMARTFAIHNTVVISGTTAPALGSICGLKFNDLNGNGVRDKDEPGLPNWRIGLNIAAIPPVTTDSLGNYCFRNLPAGTYTVSEVMQAGWQQTAPSSPGTYTVTLAAGQNIKDQNFGNKRDSCATGTKAWSPLGTGMNGEVWALAAMGGNLYAGGVFTTAGGVSANRIAKWDGVSWSPLGSGINNGMNGGVWALAAMGGKLFAAGYFTTAGGVSAENIAQWDGTSWSPLGSGLVGAGAVEALAVIGTDLYAGGAHFTMAGGVPVNNIAKWNSVTSVWSPLGSGMNDRVNSLTVIGTDLYAGGQFINAGGVSANFIAKWNGISWSALGTGMNLRVGGGLGVLGGNLYAGGVFTTAGGVSANRIAKWDGVIWSPLGTGMNDGVEGFAVIGTDLYASGGFTTAGSVSANRVAKWDGVIWSPLGSGMNDGVWRLAVIGNDLYAGGIFTTAGGVSANYIAKYSCGIPTSVDEDRTGNTLPKNFKLEQNYPNPFNPSTSITFSVPVAGKTTLKIYNLLGQEVATLVNRVIEAGTYSEQFSAAKLTSGVYFYVLQSQNFREVKKMTLLK